MVGRFLKVEPSNYLGAPAFQRYVRKVMTDLIIHLVNENTVFRTALATKIVSNIEKIPKHITLYYIFAALVLKIFTVQIGILPMYRQISVPF